MFLAINSMFPFPLCSFHLVFISCSFLLSWAPSLLAFFVLFRFSSLFYYFIHLFSLFLSLQLTHACRAYATTCNIYVVVFLGWQSEFLV